MRATPAPTSTRPVAAILVVACTGLSGCFALFSLDGYGPPADDRTLGDAGAPDGPLEASRDAPGVDAASPGRTIFVTSAAFNGDLGARDGGDTACQIIAAGAGLPGRYRVWLSDVSGDGDAVDHLVRDAGPLRLPNGAVVAADVDELVDAGPRVAIAVDERGRKIGGGGCNDGGLAAWTDTSAGGVASGDLDCARWSTSAAGAQGNVGLVAQPGSAWTEGCTRSCASTAALYCIQQ